MVLFNEVFREWGFARMECSKPRTRATFEGKKVDCTDYKIVPSDCTEKLSLRDIDAMVATSQRRSRVGGALSVLSLDELQNEERIAAVAARRIHDSDTIAKAKSKRRRSEEVTNKETKRRRIMEAEGQKTIDGNPIPRAC